MVNDKGLFGQRLRNAREMRGLSLADLSHELQEIVSRQAIYKYEAGIMLPESTVLLRLARILDVKPDYFFRPFSISLDCIEFRRKASMSVKSRKAVQQIVFDNVERYLEIEDICGLPQNNAFEIDKEKVSSMNDVIKYVAKLRSKWGLGFDGIADVIALLENKGIKVLEVSCDNMFDGLSGKAGGNVFIVLNRAKIRAERKRFTALHELGHIMMDFDENVDEKKKESFCHLFASEFLIPQQSFKESIGNIGNGPMELHTFADIQRTFGISIDALIRKAHDANMINDGRYKNYFIRKNQNKIFKNYVEESRIDDETPQRFESLVYNAYSKEIISASKAASLLNKTVDEVVSTALFV